MKKHILSALFLCLFASFQNNTFAQVGEVLNFNGAGDYLSTANNFQLTSFTIEAWVNTLSTGNQTIISTGDGNGNGDENFIFQIQDGKIGLFMAQAGPTYNWRLTASIVPNNTWCHVAVSYDNTTHIASFYLDGKFVGNGTYPLTNPNFSTGGVFVGRQGYGCQCNFFTGSMEELHIWNTALTCDNINLNKNTSPNVLQAGLVASYRFNQGTAGGNNTGISTVDDSRLGNPNPLTIVNLARTGPSSNFLLGGPTISGTTDLTKFVEINVIDQTNTLSILDGDLIPDVNDGTDFGDVDITSGSVVKTFNIQNTGNTFLNLTGSPYVSVTGAGFSLFTDAIGSIPGSSFSDFSIMFDPTVTGTSNGTVTIGSEDCDETSYTFAITGKGISPGTVLHFDGTNDVIETGFVPSAAVMKNFTYECWVKGDAAPTTSGEFNGPMYAYKSGIIWDHMNGSFVGSATVYNQVGSSYSASFGPLLGNTWYHLAATYDGSVLRAYTNGVLITSEPTGVGGIFDEATTLKLGTHPGGALGFFAGQIDEARVWSRALSAAEIAAHMNCELSGPQECLELYYKCNQGDAGGNNAAIPNLIDLSGKGRNGTFVNFGLTTGVSNFLTGTQVSGNCSAAAFPEIQVRQSVIDIFSGDTYSFSGSTLVGQTSTPVSFSIENFSSTKVLSLSGAPNKVIIGGTNPSDFIVNSATVGGTVVNGVPELITISFNPSSPGVRTATITVPNDDCDEGSYTFTVSGIGASAASSLRFDGSGDYVELPPSSLSSTALDDSLTIEFWFNTESTGSDVLFSTMDDASPFNGIEIALDNGKLAFLLANTAGNYNIVTTSLQFNDSLWHHAAFVYKGNKDANTIDIIVDGILQTKTVNANQLTLPFNNSNIPTIGARGNSTPGFFYNGIIDEFRIWNRSFCDLEINTTKGCESTGSKPKLITAFNFNNGIGDGDNSSINTIPNSTGTPAVATLQGFDKIGSLSNFITSGGVVSGTVCTTPVLPAIQVLNLSGTLVIAHNDTFPSLADKTDFGNVGMGNSVVMQYSIKNNGAVPLNFINLPSSIGVGGSTTFKTMGSVPTFPLPPGGTNSFSIRFNPTVAGLDSTLISIYSNDCSKPVYVFKIRANATQPPEIEFSHGITHVTLQSGDTMDLGTVSVLKTSKPRSCSIKNNSLDGTLTLIGPPYVRRVLDKDYTALTITQSSISPTFLPGVSKDFEVKMYAGRPGYSHATIQILSNDPDEPTFSIPVKLRGVISGDISDNDTIEVGSEIAGDVDLDGIINKGIEIAGDVNGDGLIAAPEFVGDVNGNFVLDPGEVVGDINGTGGIDGIERAGDTNGNGTIDGTEFTGDSNGNGVLDIPGEVVGDINGNGVIDNGEVAGDVNGDKVLTASETTPPSYVMNGKPVISTNTVSQYSLVPPLPTYFTYAWQYSDETMLMVKDTTRSFMDIIANYATNDGTLACYIYQFGLPYDTVYYPIDVNKGYVNITELAQMDSACAQVNNPNNKCQNNYIDFFKLNKINFDNNGCIQGGYQDLTESVYTTELEMGFNYTVELKPEKLFFIPNPLDPLNPDTVTMYYALWLDYNNDGDFEDAYEYLKNGDSKSLETKLINISIANNKNYEGSRRFRVAMRSGIGFSANESCSLVGESGEMEDYLVTLIPMKQLEGPNFLTPNNDGENDILSIKGVDAEKSREFTVMTKGGIIVYQSDDKDGNEFNSAWNGVDKNGKLLPKGTYYYIIKNGGAEFKTFLEIDY